MPTASSTSRRPSTRKPRTAGTDPDESPTAAVIAFDSDVVEFDVEFTNRAKEPEVHTFRARPEFGYKRMREAALARQRGGTDAVMMFERMIIPSLLDDDGTPNEWQPQVEDGHFEDPDGVLRPTKDLQKVMDPDAGSSLRRWSHLMDVRDDLNIEFEEIAKTYDLLVEKSSGRPTRRSKSS